MKKMFRYVLAIILFFAIAILGFAASGETIVLITNTGERYHTERCASVRNSKIEITLEAAVVKGYGPCGRYKPPVLKKAGESEGALGLLPYQAYSSSLICRDVCISLLLLQICGIIN